MYVAATFAIAAVASVGLVAAAPAPAQAATCYYSSCYNQDPSSTDCSTGARTIGWISDHTEIRYSSTCQATWLRDSTFGFTWASSLTQYTYNSNSTYLYSLDIPWAGYNGAWTKMVPLPESGLTQVYTNGWWSGMFNTK